MTNKRKRLDEKSFLTAENVTGTYGTHTRLAVADFQKNVLAKSNNIGIVDRETYQGLESRWNEWVNENPYTWLVDDE